MLLATVRLDLSTGAQDAAMTGATMTIPEPTGKDAEEVELQERGSPRRSRLVHRGRVAATALTSTNSLTRCEPCKEMSGVSSRSALR